MKQFRAYLSTFVTLILLTACSGTFSGNSGASAGGALTKKPFRSQVEQSFAPKKINKVAILPLQSDKSQQIAESARQSLSKRLSEKIELGTGLSVANLEFPTKASMFIAESERLARPLHEKAKFLGEKLEVQGVFYGVITRFGGDLRSSSKAEQSASAGFKLWLLDTASGNIVWSATYERQQQALTDNLLAAPAAFKDGLSFKSRDQLFEQGFQNVAEDLSLLRKSNQVKKQELLR